LPDPGTENTHRTTFDNQWIELDSVDSTNNYAMARIHAGMASEGLVCLARHQWAGKGQRGRSWRDEPGQNLMMSLVIKPGPLDLSRQFLFSAAVALSILEQVRLYSPDHWSIKWPNDIYWNDRKAAGILVESVIQGNDWLFAVAGVGMNLNQEVFPPELSRAVSLKQITSIHYDLVQTARDMVKAIQNGIQVLRKDPELVLRGYIQSMYKINQPIAMRKGKELIIATLQGVDAAGLLQTSSGSFEWGEVEFIVDR